MVHNTSPAVNDNFMTRDQTRVESRYPTPRAATYLRPRPRVVTGGFGVVASMLLHLLVIILLWRGIGEHRTRIPPAQGAAAGQNSTSDSALTTLIFIEESAAVHDSKDRVRDALSRPPLLQSFVTPVAPPEVELSEAPVQHDQETIEHPLDAWGDQTGHALMFGRYMGQITARIERAWRRPRTAVEGRLFTCHFQVTQDAVGNVQEVNLLHCNGDARWQLSLVRAVQAASPLPAPPEPEVFANTLTLKMDSAIYEQGSDEEGFEPSAPLAAVDVAPADLRRTLETLRAAKRPDSPAIGLTIVGSATNP